MSFNSPSPQRSRGPMAEINVTPMVDVMLVLLVIFMVTAPMMFSGIHLQLPKTKRVENIHLSGEQIILSLTASQEYYLGKDKILMEEIVPLIQKRIKEGAQDTVFIRADHSLPYGKIAQLMVFLKKAKILNLALVTEAMEGP